jgi:hypothetical protein
MKNLLVEVKRLRRHRFAQRPTVLRRWTLVTRQRASLLYLEGRLICLEDNVGKSVGVVYPEVIVV